jgi:hypothetical protein
VTPPEVLEQLEALGYRLDLRPGGLRLSGGTKPTSEVLALIQAHRAELLALLVAESERDLLEERAGILEFQAGFTRGEADLRAGVATEQNEPALSAARPETRHRQGGPGPEREGSAGSGAIVLPAKPKAPEAENPSLLMHTK